MTTKTRAGAGIALAILLAGTFMTALDVSIVNVAAPKMQAGLGLSGATLQLVISGYSVAFAALLVTGARLGDDHGHRRLFMIGLLGFTATSLLCGLAWSPGVLVVARILQGASGALMTPQVVTVIQLWYAAEARARALALYATVICAGAVVGQILGGALVSADIAGTSWRPVFLVNVPVGLALLVAGPRVLPHTRAERSRKLDPLGVALLTGFIVLVMVPLVSGHQAGWAWWTWACLAAAVPTGAALVLHLRREQRRGGDPLIDLGLLRRAPVALGLTSVAAQMVAYGGFLFALTLHLQGGLGESPLRSGLTFGPYAVGFAVTSLAAPMLPPQLVRRVAAGGLAAMALGYIDLALVANGGDWHDAADAADPRARGRGLRGRLQPGHRPRGGRRPGGERQGRERPAHDRGAAVLCAGRGHDRQRVPEPRALGHGARVRGGGGVVRGARPVGGGACGGSDAGRATRSRPAGRRQCLVVGAWCLGCGLQAPSTKHQAPCMPA